MGTDGFPFNQGFVFNIFHMYLLKILQKNNIIYIFNGFFFIQSKPILSIPQPCILEHILPITCPNCNDIPMKEIIEYFIRVPRNTFKGCRSKKIQEAGRILKQEVAMRPRGHTKHLIWICAPDVGYLATSATADWVYLVSEGLRATYVHSLELASIELPGIGRRWRWCRCGFLASRHYRPKSIIGLLECKRCSMLCTYIGLVADAPPAVGWNHKLQLASAVHPIDLDWSS